jgi:hypothetical protein
MTSSGLLAVKQANNSFSHPSFLALIRSLEPLAISSFFPFSRFLDTDWQTSNSSALLLLANSSVMLA